MHWSVGVEFIKLNPGVFTGHSTEVQCSPWPLYSKNTCTLYGLCRTVWLVGCQRSVVPSSWRSRTPQMHQAAAGALWLGHQAWGEAAFQGAPLWLCFCSHLLHIWAIWVLFEYWGNSEPRDPLGIKNQKDAKHRVGSLGTGELKATKRATASRRLRFYLDERNHVLMVVSVWKWALC